ncbi:MAG: DUF350 domain-containing protein [Patescibacteria group bacterium]
MPIFKEYLIMIGWALAGGISMAIILPVVLKIFSVINPIDEWEEIKKGNLGVALIMVSVILAVAIVIGFAIS